MNKSLSFVDWLNRELAQRNWSQAELARQAKISRTAVSDVLAERRGPGPDFCRAIASALAIPQETVFRAAGLLDPLPGADPLQDEWDHIFHNTPPEERDALIERARFELEQIKKRQEK